MVGEYSFSYSFRTLNATFDHTEVFFHFTSVMMSCMINQKFLSYKVNFKDFYTKLTNISDGIFILSPGSWPTGGTFGRWGCPGGQKKNFKHGHVEYQIGVMPRAATFTHVNGTVSCFCNKRLQN